MPLYFKFKHLYLGNYSELDAYSYELCFSQRLTSQNIDFSSWIIHVYFKIVRW